MPKYVFRCANPECLVNLPESDGRVARASSPFGEPSAAMVLDGTDRDIEVAYPTYAAMRAAEARDEPRCSMCKQVAKRRVTAPGIGTTRHTTPAKKRLDCAVGQNAERQWRMIERDRETFGGDGASAERIERFKREDAAAKQQAAEMVRDKSLVPRKGSKGQA